MLKALKKEKQEVFSVCDIETGKEGNLLVIGLYNSILEKPLHFYSWNDFLQFLQENNDNNYYQKIFAHNGGGFDWVHLFSWFFIDSDLDKTKVEIVLTGSSIIFASINQFENTINFCDTLLTLKSSLDKLCDVFKPDAPKLKDFPIDKIEQLFRDDKTFVLKYLDNDCISLLQIMHKFMALIEIDFFPLTVASLGLYVFKKDFFPEDLKIYKPSPIHDEFITDSYAGGRVECFRQGKHKQVYTYDINSLYPYIMSFCQIPICKPSQTKSFLPNRTGFYRITFKQTNKTLPPVLWNRTAKQGLVFVYEGKGVFSNHEIELALKVGCEIKFHFGIYYPETKQIFKPYVDHFYNLRKTFDSKHPMQLVAKYLLNSLYGKWGQKETTNKLVSMTPKEYLKELKDGKLITDYDTENNLYSLETTRPVPHRIIYIASIITALARCEIYKYIESNIDNLIYCDTDCVHLTKPMSKNIGEKLGQMKKEQEGRSIHIGRKMYGIFDNKTKKEKITFKGLTTKSKLKHDELNLENLEEVLNQTLEQEKDKTKCYTYSFSTFPKFKSVLKGQGKAGKIKPITKVLKKPEYTTNFLKPKKDWFGVDI